ncbi:MAG: LacI family transcriptional regulator [Candidatus Hydrogenedentes bacterium]|nr:LacI family transcriptional regulator [Candidatus Hydrogenedentota bacterium]
MLTAKDIADLSGVSRTTVFAVLGGKPGVTEKTREKVLEVLREHGYQNGLVQRSMVAELSKIIGAVIGNINNPFYTELITGIDKVLAPEGFHHLLHYGTDLDPREGIAAFDALGEYNLRGYIMAAGEMARYESHIRRVVALGRPLVTIMRAPGVQTSAVWFDDRKCSRDATDYLISRGHRRILCLTGPSQSAIAKERILGFMESLVAHDIEFHSSMVVRGGDTSDDGYKAALNVLRDSASRPTAIECCNDLVAIGVYRAAYELGLRIPEDVSVVGFDGIELGEVLGPPLTTLSVFPRRMGEIAAEMLLAIINGKHRRGHMEHVIEHALIERASVRSV